MPPSQQLSTLSFDECEWDENKRRINLAKHKIDFEDAAALFDAPALVIDSGHKSESRFLAIGCVSKRLITVVFTMRGARCRIISARRARENEQRAYHQAQAQ